MKAKIKCETKLSIFNQLHNRLICSLEVLRT